MSKRLPMRKISEVLRLSKDGLSNREIAQSIGVSPSTVGEYIRRAKSAGLSYPLPPELSEVELQGKLYPIAPLPPSKERPQPDWEYVHREMGKKHVTLELLWQEFKANNPQGHQYSAFCQAYRKWTGQLNLSMRQTHPPGERTFVDYAGTTLGVTDPDTGEIRQAQVFVAVLGASNLTYCEATWTQSVVDWLGSHVRAMQFFGGVTAIVVPDNLKSGVVKASLYEPQINVSYLEWAQHYSTVIMPARVRKPKDKSKVEVAVLIVSRWIIAALRNRKFFSLAELNKAIQELLALLNNKPFKKLKGCRRDAYEAFERAALKPLPSQRYEMAIWGKSKVNIDYHIDVDGHYYSVPFQHVKLYVETRLTDSTLEIFISNQRVASHVRSYNKGRHTTIKEHMPLAHQEMSDWTPGRLQAWAKSIGPKTHQFIAQLIESKAHPQQAYRSCLGVLRFEKSVAIERLEAACERAMELRSISFRTINSLLKSGLEKPKKSAQTQDPLFRDHENVRGPQYFH
jgi:transposase